MRENACYSKAAALISDRRLTFFCGAGISRDAPARAPLWNWLRDSYIHALAQGLRSAQPKSFLHHLDIVPNQWDSAKPEVMCEILYRQTGEQFFDSLSILNLGRPNLTHRALAQLSKRGVLPWLLTTNFDEYVEDALVGVGSINIAEEFSAGDVSDFVRFVQNRRDVHYHAVFVPEIRRDPRIPEPKMAFPGDVFEAILSGNREAYDKWRQEQENAQAKRKIRKTYSFGALAGLLPQTYGLKNLTCVVKLHGTISAPQTIIATLVDAARPLPVEVQAFLAGTLADYGCIFVGYSGRDHDIYPFLVKCAEDNKIVNPFLWMSGPSGPEPHIAHLLRCLPRAACQWSGTAADLCRSLSESFQLEDDDTLLTNDDLGDGISDNDDLANAEQHIAEWTKSLKTEPTISVQKIWMEGPGYPSREWVSMVLSILEEVLAAEGFYLEANDLAESRRRLLYSSMMTIRGADVPLRISIAENLLRAELFDKTASLLSDIKEDVTAPGAKYVYVERELNRYKVATSTLLARVHMKLGNLSAAFTELNSAKELASSNDDHNSVEILALDFALLDVAEGNKKRARSALHECQRRLAERGYVVEWVNCIQEIARLDLDDGDWGNALKGLSVVLNYRRSLGDRVLLADSLVLMIEALCGGGERDKASQYLDELRTLSVNPLVQKRTLAAAQLLSAL